LGLTANFDVLRRCGLQHLAGHGRARSLVVAAAVALTTGAAATGGLAYFGALPTSIGAQPVRLDVAADPVALRPSSAAEPLSPRPADLDLPRSNYARLLESVFQGLSPSVAPEPEPTAPPKGQLKPEAQVKASGVLPPGQAVPLPVPRPAEGPAPRVAQEPPPAKLAAVPAPAAPVEESKSLLDRLLNVLPSAPVPPSVAPGTAVYDISARTVYLPNGERLEAHSGLRENLDDPRQVKIRMRGPTPPGTYDLTEREKPFHGVRALRMNPVGGSAAVHGRDGLLAHTYMLGPNGDSNGCVSFKDYDRFLQAYLKGEVQRLVVVAGSGSPQKFAGADAWESRR
jgi:hypothetical protein